MKKFTTIVQTQEVNWGKIKFLQRILGLLVLRDREKMAQQLTDVSSVIIPEVFAKVNFAQSPSSYEVAKFNEEQLWKNLILFYCQYSREWELRPAQNMVTMLSKLGELQVVSTRLQKID